MGNNLQINVDIKPTWSILNDIKEQAISYMESKKLNREITEASIMCAVELVENAIKYGTEKPDSNNIEFVMIADDKNVKIKISNGFKSKDDIKSVIEHIDLIKASDNPEELYTKRLLELLEDSKPGVSQLGLYRIAYEGSFKLSCEYTNDVLTILAERKINEK